MAISKTSINGFNVSELIYPINFAPRNEANPAQNDTRIKNIKLNFIFLEYSIAAILVPDNAAILFVPKMVGKDKFGNEISKAGTCIRPPPPTTESIKPAINENIIIEIIVIVP